MVPVAYFVAEEEGVGGGGMGMGMGRGKEKGEEGIVCGWAGVAALGLEELDYG